MRKNDTPALHQLPNVAGPDSLSLGMVEVEVSDTDGGHDSTCFVFSVTQQHEAFVREIHRSSSSVVARCGNPASARLLTLKCLLLQIADN